MIWWIPKLVGVQCAEGATYYLYYYLFKSQEQTSISQGGGDLFVGEKFKNWKNNEKLLAHVEKHMSAHNKLRQKCEDLMKPQIDSVLTMWLSEDKRNKKIQDYVDYNYWMHLIFLR